MTKLKLDGLSVEDLNTELDKAEEQYQTMTFNNAVGNLENTSELKVVRRNIARIKTQLRAQELEGSTQKRDRIQARRRLAKKIKK
jgi:large subunit ribosomal protein L29